MYRSIYRTLTGILIFAIVTMTAVPARLATQDQSSEIVLAEGTAVNVVTVQETTSKDAKPNDPVNFTVNEDLVINGTVIVRKGTAAIGSVINAEKRGYMGKSGKLGIQVESTQTVDGQPLKLRAVKGKEGNDKTDSTTELARMDNGRYFALRLRPGKHLIRMTDDKKGYAIDMRTGQTYFFRVGIEAGMWKGHGKLTLDDADRAIAEIKKIKFIGKDKIKAPSIVVDIPL